jgi:hypothetical protein
MSLLSMWKSNKDEFTQKQIQQLVSVAGDGSLRDGNKTSKELREFLAAISTDDLARHLSSCLDSSFNDSGLVLQDIINELGSRLDYDVSPGLYRGKTGEIGFDGIWKAGGDHLIVEVKTTDAYTIDLNRIANYRKELIKKGTILESSSILMVVGRKDTNSLEAQVRGSRYAWDIRIISADALLRLVKTKESADNKETISKIRSILTPLELTKLDFVVDLLATTAADIQEATSDDEEEHGEVAVDRGSKKEKKFTPVAFNEEVAKAAEKHLKLALKKTTRSLYISSDQSTSVRALVSKEHEKPDSSGYWYAFHPYYKDPLNEHKKNYIAFGCGSPDKILIFPLDLFIEWLPKMNTTERDDRMYWHVQYQEQKGTFKLHLKEGAIPPDVTKYLIAQS